MTMLASPRHLFRSLIEKAQRTGSAYTALDAMKLFAIVNMTVDHIGAFVFPDELWWRAIGRITFPVWFFLVGYSRGRGIGKSLWIYAALLILIHPLVGRALFPVNALVTIVFCRWLLNLCTDRGWLPGKLPEIIVACAIFSPMTMPFFEYGSVAFLYALIGRMVREGIKPYFLRLVGIAYALFIVWQVISFKFDMIQHLYVVLGTAGVVAWLARCPNTVIWPNWQESRFKTFLTVLSRNTLPYYFWHRLILQLLGAAVLGTLGFTLKFF